MNEKNIKGKKQITISYDLKDVLSILELSGSKKLFEAKKVKPTFIDTFLYSGRFNSVLGLNGFQIFKEQLRDVVKKVNADDFGSNYINLDKMYEALLGSGVYYIEQHLPSELKEMKMNPRWLTAYRYVARNFPKIDYKTFRVIVKRFEDTNGHSFYLANEDTEGFVLVSKSKNLFRESIDAKAALLQLSQKELKEICELTGTKAARSIEDTADRIVEEIGEKAIDFLPANAKARKTLFIKDVELATGTDIIELDSYLRVIAKVVRQDLTEFIDKQRHGVVAA